MDEIAWRLLRDSISTMGCLSAERSHLLTSSKTECRFEELYSPLSNQYDDYLKSISISLQLKESPLEEKARKFIRRKIRGIGRVSPIRWVIYRYHSSDRRVLLNIFKDFRQQESMLSGEIHSYPFSIEKLRAQLIWQEGLISDLVDRMRSSQNSNETRIQLFDAIKVKREITQKILGYDSLEMAEIELQLAEIENQLTDSQTSVDQVSQLADLYDAKSQEKTALKSSADRPPPFGMIEGDRYRYFARSLQLRILKLALEKPRVFGDLKVSDMIAIAWLGGELSDQQAEILYQGELYQEEYNQFWKTLLHTGVALTRTVATVIPVTSTYAILGGAIWDGFQQSRASRRQSREEPRVVR